MIRNGTFSINFRAHTHPAARASFADTLIEGLRQGVGGTARDLALIAAPWGFDLARVRQPVDLWHGDADFNIPVTHAERLAASLPNARIHVRPFQGHYEAYAPGFFAEILRALGIPIDTGVQLG